MKIREWIKLIRENIEAMKCLVREISPTNPNKTQKSKFEFEFIVVVFSMKLS